MIQSVSFQTMIPTYQPIALSQRIEIICIGFITISGQLNQDVSSGVGAATSLNFHYPRIRYSRLEAAPTIQACIFMAI